MRVELCRTQDVPEGEAVRVDVDGGPSIAVYNLAGRFYATADRCTHGDASLSDGFVDEDVVECPLHGGAFDIRTGAPTSLPCVTAVVTYDLVIVGDTIFAVLDSGA
jgi:nitrite reductase/ring-hydroxylating ferredoxin subunit